MGKITIVDECLAPEKYIYLRYSGKNPWGVAHKISGLIKPFFHVSSSGTNQTRINWDVTDDPIGFYSIWWVKRSLSRWSGWRIHIKVQGKKSKTTNEGEFTLQLNGEITTRFSGWGFILKPAWLLYSYIFYNRVRRKYIESCRNMIFGFYNELKEHYNLEKTNIPSEYGVFG